MLVCSAVSLDYWKEDGGFQAAGLQFLKGLACVAGSSLPP